NILVSGASGPIGGALTPALAAAGHRVTCLVRRAPAGSGEVQWDPYKPVPPEIVSGYDAVVHLAGETIVGHWDQKKKQKIRDSRVSGTQNLAQALAQAPEKPGVLISASAIGYYGNRGDERLTENSEPGYSFLGMVCREWEAATQAAAEAGIRTVQLRIGIMLSMSGGALKQMVTPFRYGLGGIVGNGKQYWSWVALEDVAGAVQHALVHDGLAGPVNVVSPNPVTNIDFTRAIAQVLRRPALFPLAPFAVRLFFGQMGEELLLASARVLPTKLEASGYKFRYPELKPALVDILRK
ncbi:MAG TPA: TIGR01777 family oxidoreductase, partial [Terriglobales bacterium]|nr:TIGR01777 family oxidoreductase [Terriglobales bacterium]